MTVREFLDSDIDISYNDEIILYVEKFPPTSITVENPQYLWGFSDDLRVRCEEAFKDYLDYSIETLIGKGSDAYGYLELSLF